MAFGNIGTVYLTTAATAGASIFGTDVRKVAASADAGTDGTTQTTHTIGVGVKRVTLDPHTNHSADLTEADYGWAIATSDMNSVAGALRRIPSGDHTFTIRTGSNRDMAGANAGYHFAVYKVGVSPTFTRTLIQAADTGAFDYGPAGSVITRTGTLPSVTTINLAAGETVMWSLEISCTGVALNSRIATHYTGTESAVATKIDFPAIETIALMTGSASGVGTASGAGASISLMTGAATGTGTATGAGASVKGMVGSASGAGVADGAGASISGMVGASSGSAVATGAGAIVLGMVGSAAGSAVADGAGAIVLGMVGTAAGAGAADGAGASIVGMVGAAAGSATADGAGASVKGMVGSAEGSSTASGSFGIIKPMVGSCDIGGGGGDTIVHPVFTVHE